MDYLKIAETANRCEVKSKQIAEYYRIIGANPRFPEDVKNAFSNAIADMEKELKTLETKLKKLIN
jgi:hypothetical protein